MKNHFFDDVNILTEFMQVTDPAVYSPVPNNWHVVVSDIENSTQAIERDKYKEVNMGGASIIAAISNLYKDYGDLPFSFGGDGAIIIIPDERLDEANKRIEFCRSAVMENFGLNMKGGIVSVSDIQQAGHEIRVAKFALSEKIRQTLFIGNGISYAEGFIKQNDQKNSTGSLQEPGQYSVFEGLECRWKRVPPDHDEITAYIIKANSENVVASAKIYDECLQKINSVYGPLENQNPLSQDKLTFTKNLKKLMVEWKIRTWKPTLKRQFQYGLKLAFQIFVGQYLMWKKTITKNTDWGRYKPDLVRHADFKKFDDGLKFIVSGTKKQREEMQQFLDEKMNNRKLYYGIHSSKGLIITCYIKNYHKHHVHFVDGSEGGYALAAKMLKQQIEDSKN